MIYDSIQNIDSLQTVQDTISNAADSADVFNKITFDPGLIANGNGVLISVIGYMIVFLALLFLYIIFANLTKLLHLQLRKKLKAEGHETEGTDLTIPGEITAAISMGLHLHFAEVHD